MPTNKTELSVEHRRFRYSLGIILFLSFLLFAVKLIETSEGISLIQFGIKPHTIIGLRGILTAPLVHSDWAHLFSNLSSFMVLGVALFFFYKELSFKVLLMIYLGSGIVIWFIGRDSYHIGASGIIYGMATFLFFSGIIRRYIPLLAISLIVVFLYGSMVWGIFPITKNLPYSWEAHLSGSLIGGLLSIVYRKQGPQKPPSNILVDDEFDDETSHEQYFFTQKDD